MPYEIVVHARGVKDEIVSPTTYTTTDAAAKDLEPIRQAIAERGMLQLDWYGGSAANIIAAVIRETDTPRTARSFDDLVAALAARLGFTQPDESPKSE